MVGMVALISIFVGFSCVICVSGCSIGCDCLDNFWEFVGFLGNFDDEGFLEYMLMMMNFWDFSDEQVLLRTSTVEIKEKIGFTGKEKKIDTTIRGLL